MKPIGPIPPGWEALDGVLSVDGAKLTDVAAEAGETPLFVYSRALLTQKFEDLRAAMPGRLAIHYAMKANPFGPLLQHMNGLVDGFDIASGGELDEFDLNEFFAANGTGVLAQFKHKDEVQKWQVK